MANVDPILAAGLAAMTKSALCIELCAGEPRSMSEMHAESKACKDCCTVAGPMDRLPTGKRIRIDAFHDGKCKKHGKVTHWVLHGGGQIWASGPLDEPIDVRPGLAFEFPDVWINLPGAA